MANETKRRKADSSDEIELIDPIYEKFTKGVIRALGSTAFYEYFMQAIAMAENSIQFSNRRVEKIVDTEWVEAIETAL